MEQHCLRPVAKQDNESAGVLVAQPFEKPAEPTCGITRCHYFVECELFHRVSPWAALHAQALASPADFFALRDRAGGAAARLVALKLEASIDPDEPAAATVALIDDLRPPTAFYVRLLAPEVKEFPVVECFFRDVVDHVIDGRGFTPREMGRETPEIAFMNAEIFNALHRAALVVVDLTAMRTNCLMELGYALGRRRRVVISAQDGTHLGFDHDKLPTYFWKDAGTVDERRAAYRGWLDLYSGLPPIVD